jgi:hypothetical protein
MVAHTQGKNGSRNWQPIAHVQGAIGRGMKFLLDQTGDINTNGQKTIKFLFLKVEQMTSKISNLSVINAIFRKQVAHNNQFNQGRSQGCAH